MAEEITVFFQGSTTASHTCILMHGFGADASDLMGLSSEINTSKDLQFLFPQAPYDIQVAGSSYGTSWFPRTEDEIMQAFTGDYFMDLETKDPTDLSTSAIEMLGYIEKNALNWSDLIIGGFSQGAMIAVELALRAPVPPAALVLLSGNFIARDRWGALMEEAMKRWGGSVKVPFFQSHGTMDPVLGVEGAEKLYDFLSNGQFEGELYSFYGGHEIPRDTLDELVQFINGL